MLTNVGLYLALLNWSRSRSRDTDEQNLTKSIKILIVSQTIGYKEKV